MISVVIPCFNARKTICRSITSVLQQSGVDIEVIVVDDGSTDDTKEIVDSIKDPRLQYVWQVNAGPSAARNKGVELASGKFIAFLDADDEWYPRKLLIQLQYMQEKKKLASVTDVEERSLDGRAYVCKKPDLTNRSSQEVIDLIYQGKITRNTPTLVVEKNLFNQVGGFDLELKNREDHYLLCKLAEKGKLCILNEELTIRHLVRDSYSLNYDIRSYYFDTLIFHMKMYKDFPFIDLKQGIKRTKLMSLKKSIKSKNILPIFSIILDRKWREILFS